MAGINSVVTWRVSGERDTLMLARYKWYRFEIKWPVSTGKYNELEYPLSVFYKDVLDCECKFETLHKAVAWIVESCKDLSLSEDTDWKRC